MNWFPLGITYALLYFGRYNLSANVAALDKLGLLSKHEFGNVDFWGSITYGVAFLLNGPLTDRWGGRVTILIAAGGSAVMNLAMAAALLADEKRRARSRAASSRRSPCSTPRTCTSRASARSRS
jgi:OPA family glycerol-3-phosphate transporter-like MFS transporter